MGAVTVTFVDTGILITAARGKALHRAKNIEVETISQPERGAG